MAGTLIPYLKGLEHVLEALHGIGGATFSDASLKQSEKVVGMLATMHVPMIEASQAIEIVSKLRWAAVAHKDAVVAAISSSTTHAPPQPHQRGSYQNYTSLPNFSQNRIGNCFGGKTLHLL